MKVSIITITYNRAHLIGDTIQSVLNQTYTDFEHIIIDDGSTDNTEEVVKNFNDERIRYYHVKKNKRSFLRNEGIRKSTGELISILDSDDIWRKDKLEIVTSIFINKPELNFVIHNLSFLPNKDSIKKPFSNYKKDFYKYILDDLFSNKILPYPIFTIKKDFLLTIGLLDENYIDGQHDLYLRVASNSKVYYTSKTLTYMTKHDGNISSKFDVTHCKDYKKSLQKLKKEKKITKEVFLKMKRKINIIIIKYYLKKYKLIS